MSDFAIREPDEIRRTSSGKLRPVEVSLHFRRPQNSRNCSITMDEG
jgi:hypothetical protein